MAHELASELRESVLRAALEGKLTVQSSNDTSVYLTLDKVKEIKKELVKKGEMKKEKPLEPVNDDEQNFDIPDGWIWTRMQNFLDVRDGTHDSPKYVADGYPFVTSKNLINGSISFDNVQFITKEDFEKFNTRSRVDVGDILMAMIGSIGKPVLVREKNREFAIKNVALIKYIPNTSVNMEYVLYLLNYAESIMKSQANGGVQQFVSLNYLRNFPVPLPPIEEQARIVARVDELMAKIDEYEKLENELVELKKNFPGDMKAAVLQAAMQGKLTEHLMSDGEVNRELLSTKNYPKIEELYDLPDNWINAHLEDLTNPIATKQYQILESDVCKEGEYPVISQSKEYSIGFSDNEERVFSPSSKIVLFGDHTTIVKTIDYPFVVGADGVKLFECNNSILPEYLYYVLTFNASLISEVGGYSRHYKYLKNKSIPLPPIEEQKRIVEKLDKILPLCEELVNLC